MRHSLLISLLSLPALAACGVKGPPLPPDGAVPPVEVDAIEQSRTDAKTKRRGRVGAPAPTPTPLIDDLNDPAPWMRKGSAGSTDPADEEPEEEGR